MCLCVKLTVPFTAYSSKADYWPACRQFSHAALKSMSLAAEHSAYLVMTMYCEIIKKLVGIN